MNKWIKSVATKRSLNRLMATAENIVQGTGAADSNAAQLDQIVSTANDTLGMKPFPVQVAGVLALMESSVVEMHTGEGKSLVAAMAAASHALNQRRVHLATVNEYLAARDYQLFMPLFSALGVTTGLVTGDMTLEQKQTAYQAAVVFSTAQQFGFDYLRDQMVSSTEEVMIVDQDVMILDEADSILLDQACMPLVLNGMPKSNDELYRHLLSAVSNLDPQTHYEIDRKDMSAVVTDAGYDLIETRLMQSGLLFKVGDLHALENLTLAHKVQSMANALYLYRRDVDYLVPEGSTEIVVIDEHNGRGLTGRRWSDGLHQAIEAKEGLPIRAEADTLASISYQALLCMYKHLCGLTGTASSDADEFADVYGLSVVSLPTHRPMIRVDEGDQVFASQEAKHNAVIALAVEAHQKNQPVLIGCESIEQSELIAEKLMSKGYKPALINAKEHAKEAQIIADAGRPGSITIATQMAGRGTDIKLGGCLEARMKKSVEIGGKSDMVRAQWELDNKAAVDAGGLLVIGCYRSPSRRGDYQLRGRAGRQGDPGRSVFLLSLEDELIQSCAKERVEHLIARVGLTGNEALEGKGIDRLIARAQSLRQGIDRDMRSEVNKFQAWTDMQRTCFYELRSTAMKALQQERSDYRTSRIQECVKASAVQITDAIMSKRYINDAQLVQDLRLLIAKKWNLSLPESVLIDACGTEASLTKRLVDIGNSYYEHRKGLIRPEVLERFERISILEGLDKAWVQNQAAMAQLKDGIHLRSFAREDPKAIYRIEGAKIFAALDDNALVYAAETLLGSYIPEQALIKKAG